MFTCAFDSSPMDQDKFYFFDIADGKEGRERRERIKVQEILREVPRLVRIALPAKES